MEGLVEQLHDCYRGKRILITGDTGFKGSWLKQLLQKSLGAECYGYALPSEPGDHYELLGFIKDIAEERRFWHDIRQADKIAWAVDRIKPDMVFHLAAQSLVRKSYRVPVDTFAINAMGTVNLLEAIRRHPVPTVIITTDKVYENLEWNYPYREIDKLGGYDPYSASKALAEIAVGSYRQSFFDGMYIASARAGNVIGGGDWAEDRLLPDFARAYGKGEEVILRNPASVRPWQHVLEPLMGYLQLGMLLAANPKRYAQAYNFGPYATDTLTVGEVAVLADSLWQGGGRIAIRRDDNAPHEAGLLKLDISKAIAELGWKPRLNAETAVGWTVEWYRQFSLSQGEEILTQHQIDEYFSLLND